MGKRGPAPKPTVLRVLEGNRGKRAINRDEPKPPASELTCPSELTGKEREEWDRIAPILKGMGVLTVADTDALAAYCRTLARYKAVEASIKELMEKNPTGHGVIGKSTKGTLMVNPLFRVAQECQETMKWYMAKFGMTPSDRSGLKVGQERKESVLERLRK